ncbi:hypothetical protein Ssi02_35660 [Sinosporangium siamense]|uniref:Uncharacterized protein n=1 Tax=Sinosporangium siamense TaxID=1367973 RepID=A0A919RIB7_9ACTN|nr:hypothetical protein Ssi02_35660 [Sinosporangium siamense]
MLPFAARRLVVNPGSVGMPYATPMRIPTPTCEMNSPAKTAERAQGMAGAPVRMASRPAVPSGRLQVTHEPSQLKGECGLPLCGGRAGTAGRAERGLDAVEGTIQITIMAAHIPQPVFAGFAVLVVLWA